jgi:hypothetical protein
MMRAEDIDTLMAATGPMLPEAEGIARTGEAQWAVAWESGSVVIADLAEEGARLVLSTLLGTPAREHRETILTTLLSYNALWRETGGVTLALAGAEGEAMQLCPLATAGLDAGTLAGLLVNFENKARVWRGFVALGPANAPAELADAGAETWFRA